MPVSNVNSVNSTSSATTATASAFRMPVQQMGQEDFLKLLVAQLSAQDPMNPQKDTQFIAQMAQFSALEQSRAMQSDISAMRGEQQLEQANSLIGRNVAVQSDAGVVTGVVTGLNVATGKPQIVINNRSYALSSVLGVTAQPTTN